MSDFKTAFSAAPNATLNCTKLLFADESNYGDGNNVTKDTVDLWLAQIFKFNPATFSYDLVQEVRKTAQQDFCEFDINPVIGASLMVSLFVRAQSRSASDSTAKTITLTCLLNV